MHIPLPPVSRFKHSAMFTEFELVLSGENRDYLQQAAQAVFSGIDHLEELLSRFDPRSDISQVNRLAAGQNQRVGIETIECLNLCLILQTETNGAYDCDFRSRKKHSDPKSLEIPEPEIPGQAPGFETAAVPGGFEVALSAEVDLDLGGMGKGYALDKAWEILQDWDLKQGLIHAGASTALAHGSPSFSPSGQTGWPVGVAGPFVCQGAPGRVFLEGRALSGSGTEIKGLHVIDPASGAPARGHMAAWVSHPSAAVADALSTAFMVMGPEQVREFCQRFPDVWALVICASKKCTIFNDGVVCTDAVR
jgi:thiamine biosynthesis lipoprotein